MTAVLIVNVVFSAATLLVIVGGLSRAITAPRAEHPGATAPARARGLALCSRAALTHAEDGLNTERRIRLLRLTSSAPTIAPERGRIGALRSRAIFPTEIADWFLARRRPRVEGLPP